MANRNDRFPQNVPGGYYVDSTCIDCDMCRGIAPAFFRRDDEIGFSVVFLQPANSEEIAAAEDALTGCPAGSIGNDG